MPKVKNTHSWPKSRIIILIIGLVSLASGLIFIGYFYYSSIHSWEPNPKNLNEAKNNPNFNIEENKNYYSILPKYGSSDEGIIIYQGAFADSRAYLAPYSYLTEAGLSVFVLRSPFGFALFNVNGPNKVISQNPSIKKWYVAGHSLGGVAACEYAKANGDKLKGLILLASFCNGSAVSIQTNVLSISSSLDGFSTPQKINDSRSRLPLNTKYEVLEGGNHTQFGDFEKMQPGDNNPKISNEEATAKINNYIIDFIRQ